MIHRSGKLDRHLAHHDPVTGRGANAAYCRVDFTVPERGGSKSGYAPDEIQRLVLRVGLPHSEEQQRISGFEDLRI
jgi:hypothetical protein